MFKRQRNATNQQTNQQCGAIVVSGSLIRRRKREILFLSASGNVPAMKCWMELDTPGLRAAASRGGGVTWQQLTAVQRRLEATWCNEQPGNSHD
jgi:hypothetical protein